MAYNDASFYDGFITNILLFPSFSVVVTANGHKHIRLDRQSLYRFLGLLDLSDLSISAIKKKRETEGRTDGQTDPLIEMRGRI